MNIIGITGTDGAGKGVVVEYLVAQKNFVHYSARALWVEEIERQGLPVTRANMRLVANGIRKEHGDDYLVAEYVRRARERGDTQIVIESIRALAEANRLKADGGMLLAVDADQRLRYERVRARGSESDNISFEEFVAHEALEMNDNDPHGMQKAAVMAMADFTLVNNGTLDALHAEIEKMLLKFGF